jgi:hypothetical protein
MAKPLEFFDEFFAAPEKMRAREFYMYVHEWLDYLKEHEGEFNYLEDEEWRERKDRVLAVLTEQEDIKEEFEELQDKIDEVRESGSDNERIAVYKEWLEFMKRNQWNFDFTDEQIAEGDRRIKQLILAVLDSDAAYERLKRSKKDLKKSIADLDETLTAHYLRTGKRLVMTSLRRFKGN